MFCVTNRDLFFFDRSNSRGGNFILPAMQFCKVKKYMGTNVLLTLISNNNIVAYLTPNYESLSYIEEDMMGIIKGMKVGERYFKKMQSGSVFIMIKTDENIIFRYVFPKAELTGDGVTMDYKYADENITAYNFVKATDILSEKELFLFELSNILPKNLSERFPHV